MKAQSLSRFLARWLDQSYIDPILGLVLPEIGDLASTLAGFAVVVLAWREGVAMPVLVRMTMNLAIDGIVGAVPIVGDLFDFAFKAHTKNAALLSSAAPARATWRDYAMMAVALLGVGVAIALPIFGLIALIRWISAS